MARLVSRPRSMPGATHASARAGRVHARVEARARLDHPDGGGDARVGLLVVELTLEGDGRARRRQVRRVEARGATCGTLLRAAARAEDLRPRDLPERMWDRTVGRTGTKRRVRHRSAVGGQVGREGSER